MILQTISLICVSIAAIGCISLVILNWYWNRPNKK